MSKLIIPNEDFVLKTFLREGTVDERDAPRAVKQFLEMYQEPLNTKDDPISAMLTVDQYTDLRNEALQLVEVGARPEERAEKLSARLSEMVNASLEAESAAAIEIESALGKMIAEAKLKATDVASLTEAATKMKAWSQIPKISIWLTLHNSHYSSIRFGSASGSSGKGLSKKCSTLRVVATTLGHNLSTVLNWSTPWGSGSQPIANVGLLKCVVIASHFRGCFLGIIPQVPSSMQVGASRPGSPAQYSGNISGVSGGFTATWSNPGTPLNNITYFASSSWSGVGLYVSGNV